MSYLSISGLSMGFGEQTLFTDVTFSVEKGDKIGFIGANGAGKTTLFKIITGAILPDGGEVVRAGGLKIGYLEQHVCSAENRTALAETLRVFDDLREQEQELERINAKLLCRSDPALIERQLALTERFQADGGLTYRSRAAAVLAGLGFSEEETGLPVSALSGGQRSKIGLARLLLCKNDLILLDEPTNHLDIDAIAWLENYLLGFNGAVIIISHDRFFLDKVCGKTMELENERLRLENGNFSRYLQLKQAREEAERRDFENKAREIKRIEGIIEQQKRWNRERNIRTAESKQKQIDRIAKTMVRPESETHQVTIKFPVKAQSGLEVLTVENDAAVFPTGTLYQNVSFTVKRGERVCLIGPNGVGKSTLLKRLLSGENPAFRLGYGVSVGYFDQFQDTLDPKHSPMEEIHSAYPLMSDTAVRNALAAFEFRGDDVFKSNSALSGGERARVAICRLVLSGNNFLILDEPTNHLDLYSRKALEDALAAYEGTLLIVSHDRYFINRIADQIVLLRPDGAVSIPGNYDDYLAWVERNAALEQPAEQPREETVKKGKEAYLNQKKRRSEQARLQTAVRRAEAEIEALETEIAGLHTAISENGTDYERLSELTAALEEKETLLESKMQQWEEDGNALSVLLQNEEPLS